MQKWPEEEEEGGIKQSQKLYWNYVAVIDRISPRKVSPRVALCGGEAWREAYGYRVEIGLWSSEIAVIWRQAGRQADSCGQAPSLHRLLLLMFLYVSPPRILDKKQQRSRTRMDGNLWAGNDDKKMWTCTTKWIHNASWKQRQKTTDRGEYWKSNWTTNFRAGHWGLMRGTYN